MPVRRQIRIRKLLNTIVSLITLSLFGFAVIKARNTFFLISTINCQVIEKSNCSTELTQKLAVFKNKPWLWSNLQEQLSFELAATETFKLHDYFIQLPNTLHVQVKEVGTAYSLIVEGESRAVLTNQTVSPVNQDQPQPPIKTAVTLLPEYYFELLQNPALQHQLELDLDQVLSVCQSQSASCDHLRLPEKRFITYTLESGQQVVLLREELELSLARLVTLLPSITTQEDFAEIKEIDVRYTFPVLRKQMTVL